MCCHLNHSCDCNDVAAQPCIAALIADYLEALTWNVRTVPKAVLVIRCVSPTHIAL
jgi:hypothetical protein